MNNDGWNMDVFDEYIYRCDADRICGALKEENEEKAYELLKKKETVFTTEEAFKLCEAAISIGCVPELFEALLEKCPPVEKFRYFNVCDNLYGHGVDIVALAALMDRVDLLKLMLNQNININHHYGWCSILEAALEGASIDCVEQMLSYEELEIPITEQLLYIWGDAGRSLKADICYASVAERILGIHVDLNVDEVPVLGEMKIYHAIYHSNWTLFRRICKQNGAEKKSAQGALLTILYDCTEDSMENLDALMTACPALLRDEISRCELALYALRGADEVEPTVKKWIDAMPGKMLVINHFHTNSYFYKRTEISMFDIERWKERIGEKLVPTLSRHHPFPMLNEFFWGEYDKFLQWMMEHFRIKGSGKYGDISILARSVLREASPVMVAKMIENDFLLTQEDPEAMMDFCREIDALPSRFVVATYMKKENDYEF